MKCEVDTGASLSLLAIALVVGHRLLSADGNPKTGWCDVAVLILGRVNIGACRQGLIPFRKINYCACMSI